MSRVPWRAAGLAMLMAALVLPAAQPDRKRTEADLKALKEQEDRVRRQTQKDAADEDRLSKALRDAERLVSRANSGLSVLRTQRSERASARQELVEERARRQAEKNATEADLASQLRAAYFMGRSEPLKLLLNQRSPAEFGRNLTYYGYLGRLRASQIDGITKNITKIDELTAKIDEEDAKLAENMVQQKQTLEERQAAVKMRGQVLTSLKEQARNNATELKRLQAQRQQVEQLLERLRREAEAAPYDPNTPFARLKKQLSWPASGRLVINYGVKDSNGLVSQGVDIEAPAGTPVRAVYDGVVRYADWSRGRGNVIIVDHGGGYLSVYAHNDQLFKATRDKVEAGEKIATVGDTGGRARPGLHFEIRYSRNEKSAAYEPVDPRGWFRSSTP